MKKSSGIKPFTSVITLNPLNVLMSEPVTQNNENYKKYLQRNQNWWKKSNEMNELHNTVH